MEPEITRTAALELIYRLVLEHRETQTELYEQRLANSAVAILQKLIVVYGQLGLTTLRKPIRFREKNPYPC